MLEDNTSRIETDLKNNRIDIDRLIDEFKGFFTEFKTFKI